jgi:hypothetical protein
MNQIEKEMFGCVIQSTELSLSRKVRLLPVVVDSINRYKRHYICDIVKCQGIVRNNKEN